MPFGIRKLDDIRFESEPIFNKHGVKLVKDAATNIDVVKQIVETKESGEFAYDYLVIFNDFGKWCLEKYFLYKNRRGCYSWI